MITKSIRLTLGFLSLSALLFMGACASQGSPSNSPATTDNTANSPATAGINTKNLIDHNGQKIFLNGMNLAWMDFGKDLDNFNELTFAAKLNDIAYNGGNTIRWWLFVNGSRIPSYDAKGMAQALTEDQTLNLKRALDMAADRGIGLMLCLFSFDMMQNQGGVDQEQNRKLLEDPAITESFLNKTLSPLVQSLKGHPGILSWEVFNEPEGMSRSFGWTPKRVSMETIQAFTNKVAGTIHRADPQAKVTNGSWNFQTLTDRDGMTNYYRDDRLIAAGGDKDGTLDFYTVHFYPENFDDSTSPFHHPKSYWGLDKPLVIAEFASKGIVPISGKAPLKVSTTLSTDEAYLYAIENGYAGALSWTMTNHDGFGGLNASADAMNYLNDNYTDYVKIDTSKRVKTPVIRNAIPSPKLLVSQKSWPKLINLSEYIADINEGGSLKFEIYKNSNPEMISFSIDSSGYLSAVLSDKASAANISVAIKASYKGDSNTISRFMIHILDPDKGNVALFKAVTASSTDMPENKAEFAVDGDLKTRWSSIYQDKEYLDIDLKGLFKVKGAVIHWEAAFGKDYDLLGSLDGKTWFVLSSQNASDGGKDEFSFAEKKVNFVRLQGKVRGAEWGYSFWEIEIIGERIK